MILPKGHTEIFMNEFLNTNDYVGFLLVLSVLGPTLWLLVHFKLVILE